MTAPPKLNIKIKLSIPEKRGFEDPNMICDAMVACWDDLTASFSTLDTAGRDAVKAFVNEKTGEDICDCLFGDSDAFQETIRMHEPEVQVRFLQALVDVEILDPQSIGV